MPMLLASSALAGDASGRLPHRGLRRPSGRAAAPLEVRCAGSQPQGPGAEPGEAEEGRPGLYGSFVRRPLVGPFTRTAVCRRCGGIGTVPCGPCGGTGRLARGGYQKRNPVSAARVLGSKWTAMERTFGWRHFRVLQKRGQGRDTFVLLAATCDESTQFWLNMQNLKDRERWASGWLQKQEILELEAQQEAGAAGAAAAGAGGGTACKACAGSGVVACPLCSQAGQVVEL